MRMLRIVRSIMLGILVALVLGIAVLEFGPRVGLGGLVRPAAESGSSAGADFTPADVPIGGPFHLTDDTGRAVTEAAYRGRWMLVFFGYSNCPDECPLTLQKMATALKDLGPLAKRVAPLLITVDPARDTPQRLASYLANFDPRITGLTGSSDQIAAVANAYRVYYSPVEHEKSGAAIVGHSTFLYLMDPNGKFNEVFSQETDASGLAAGLRAKLTGKP